MAVMLTAAGESLIARLQAEGKALCIDRFLFAYFDGQDHTEVPSADQGMPGPDNLVHSAVIPPEYRAYVNPNQVVYSALLGSDVGDFTFNWQGLYASEHDTLVAVATFPALQKRAYNPHSNTSGNNLTRNFILEFSGARELTGINVEAEVWQLDFTVRLKGIDERERLSNRDIYGRASFLEDGWKLVLDADGGEPEYKLLPGVGYVEGIRCGLKEAMPVYPENYPCNVYLDVCMEPQGSDVVTTVQVLLLGEGQPAEDYVTEEPFRTRHYLEKVAHIANLGAEPEDGRAAWALGADTDSALPCGAVLSYSGTFADNRPIDRKTGLPNLGFALCDGGTYLAPDGVEVTTPDLRNRFIIGAGGSYAQGATGGAASATTNSTGAHTHTNSNAGATTLSAAQTPAHKHDNGACLLSVAAGRGNSQKFGEIAASGLVRPDGAAGHTINTGYTSTIGSGGSHTHTMAATGSAGAHTHTVATLPPYYALAFIMKL